MTNNSPNRIAAILDELPSPSLYRSPAQREASKRNGSLSRGPTSPSGKAKSAQNSLKHGLRSNVLVPPGDREDFDRAYRRIVRNLQEEFGSLTFTEEMEIRSLAHDYFVSDLGRQMVATLLRPNQLSNEDADLWKELRKHDRDFSRVKRAIANYKSGRPWCPTLVRATPLADRLLWFLANAENTLREDQNPDVDPLTQVEIELRAPMTKMLDILGPTRRKLADCDYLVNALMNPTKLTKLQSRRIEALVDYAFTMLLRRPPDNYATLPSKVRMQSDQMLAKSALNPSRLVVLQQYLGRLDRSIRRKLAALRRRR